MTSARARCLVLVGGLLALALTASVQRPGATYASRNISVMVSAPLTESIVLAGAASPAGGRLVQLVRSTPSDHPQ